MDLKKSFKKAEQFAGIPAIRFHDTRHAFATRLVRANVDIVSVQYLLGHSKNTRTARYAHSLADVKMAAVRKWIWLAFVRYRTLIGLRVLSGSLPNPLEIVLLSENRPVAQLVRALP